MLYLTYYLIFNITYQYLFLFFFTKVDILLKPAGDAPIMRKKKWTVERSKKIAGVAEFIKKYIKMEQSESLVFTFVVFLFLSFVFTCVVFLSLCLLYLHLLCFCSCTLFSCICCFYSFIFLCLHFCVTQIQQTFTCLFTCGVFLFWYTIYS